MISTEPMDAGYSHSAKMYKIYLTAIEPTSWTNHPT